MTATVLSSDRRPTALSGPVPRRRVSPERVAAGLTVVALLCFSLYSLWSVDISISGMLGSWENATRFLARVGAIEFPAIGDLLWLTALTVGIALLGTLLAAAISVPVAYISAANTTPGPGRRALGRFITVLARAIPDVVLAMVFILMFSFGTLPGILAIGLHSVGMISKLFADAIEQIDEGPRLAIRAAGGTRAQEFLSGVLPQVLPSWVATVLHRNDINLRGSVILGYVGIMGLGMEMSYAFKALQYGKGLGFAIVIFALCVVMEIVSSVVRRNMLGIRPERRGIGDRIVRRLDRRRGSSSASPVRAVTVDGMMRRPWTRDRVRDVSWLWAAVAVVVAALVVCDIQWGDLISSWAKVPAVASAFWPPDFGSYGAERMVGAMLETIMIAFAATVITLVLSLVLGSFAARNIAPSPGVRQGMRLLLVAIRGIPEIILAIVLVVVTGLGAQAGTLALAFCGIGLLGKLLADSFEEVSPGPQRALTATGATRPQVYASATLPQGMRAVIGHSFYMLDTNIRSATLLGIVGGGGIGYYLLNASQGSNYTLVSSIVLMILVTVLVVEGVAMWMRRVFR